MTFHALRSLRVALDAGTRRTIVVEWRPIAPSRSRRACRSTSATRRVRGNAGPTRTPMTCCANTCRRGPTSPATPRPSWRRLRASSTPGPARPSAIGHWQIYSRRLLHRPVELARLLRSNPATPVYPCQCPSNPEPAPCLAPTALSAFLGKAGSLGHWDMDLVGPASTGILTRPAAPLFNPE